MTTPHSHTPVLSIRGVTLVLAIVAIIALAYQVILPLHKPATAQDLAAAPPCALEALRKQLASGIPINNRDLANASRCNEVAGTLEAQARALQAPTTASVTP